MFFELELQRETEAHTHRVISLPKISTTARPKTGSRSSIQVSHMAGGAQALGSSSLFQVYHQGAGEEEGLPGSESMLVLDTSQAPQHGLHLSFLTA